MSSDTISISYPYDKKYTARNDTATMPVLDQIGP